MNKSDNYEQDLIFQENKPDHIVNLLEEAANYIEKLLKIIKE